MDCYRISHQSKQEPRPCCPQCRRQGWLNGRRFVKRQAKVAADGVLEWEVELWRQRACCPNPECPVRSWSVYGIQEYPHSTFPPSVAIAAVIELLERGMGALADIAQRWGCSRRTLLRWLGWIGRIVELAVLIKVCWANDPSGMPPPGCRPRQDPDPSGPAWKSRQALVESLLLLFKWLVGLMRDQGLPFEEGAGLADFLRYQFDQFRRVSWISKLSPPLRFDGFWPDG